LSYHITVKKNVGENGCTTKKIQRNGNNKTVGGIQQFHDCSQWKTLSKSKSLISIGLLEITASLLSVYHKHASFFLLVDKHKTAPVVFGG
jgi:hypothetical protein